MAESPGPEAGSDGHAQAVAVALKQIAGATERPRVVASGRGALAEQIIEIAFERGVKVREDADLAEILAAVEVESEVPLEALAAVAAILNYVYGINAPGAPSGSPESPIGNTAGEQA